MRRKILKTALVLTVIAGCVGCGDNYVAQTPEVYQPTIDFLWDDRETQAPVGDVTRLEGYTGSVAETVAENVTETEGGAVNVADAGEKATVKQNTTQNKVQNTAQSATQSVSQEEEPTEVEVTMDPEWESAWKEYLEALKEAEKYAMKYEVSQAGIADVETFVKTEVIDSDKETYPNARAWKNKACNIAFIDDTTEGVTFTVDTKVGVGQSGSQAYIMVFKFSNGAEQEIEFGGTGTFLIYLSDSARLAYGKSTAKNLDEYVK